MGHARRWGESTPAHQLIVLELTLAGQHRHLYAEIPPEAGHSQLL